MNTFNILHLSDLHIGKENTKLGNLVDDLGDELKQKKIHTVIFTGDIFHKPPVEGNEDDKKDKKDKKDRPIDEVKKKELIKEAVTFFEKLLDYLKKANADLTKKDFLFVAGNHDLYRQESNDTWSLYDGFLKKFYGDSMPEEYKDNHMLIKVNSVYKKVLLGFNSNIDDENGEERYVGHITDNQLKSAQKFLEMLENSEEYQQYRDYDKIAFFHHPCNFFEEREFRNTDGIVNNSLDVSKQLAKWNVRVVLHGHKHWAKPSIYRPLAGQEIYMFAGGAIGRLRDNCSGNIIEMSEKEICLNEIKSENSNKFEIVSTDIPDNYMKGLLLTETKKWTRDHDIDSILEMIDILYLSYEQLNCLQYSQSNLCTFKNSIKYKLGTNDQADLFGNINEVEWNKVKEILDAPEIPNNVRNRLQIDLIEGRYVAFALLGGFFTELYNAIMNVKLDIWYKYSTEFNLGTSCYYIYFDLRRGVDGAKARQELDKIMEEFQGRLYELQDFLYCIKLEIKNIFFELRNDHGQIRHCNFDASVPRLIKLLTGTNIYYREYSFVRELIQNSIDAVSFWEKQNRKKISDKPISVVLSDEHGQKYFKIRDYGIGMKQDIIEQYFTTLGRSYYKEYTERRNINYNSVSNFGIGFLSVFKPCRKIVIHTRHFLEHKCYTLEINSDCGYYTISSNPSEGFSAGTEIVCYFRDSNVNNKEIISYIRKIMLDIKYDIDIYNGEKVEQPIKSRKIRSDNYNNVIFIPFDEDTKSIKRLETKNEQDWQNTLSAAMKRYRHGILVRTEQKAAGVDILSAGILLQNTGLQDVFGESTEKLQHMKVSLNFPPNWLDIDVSREKANGIREDYIEDKGNFIREICSELKKQIGEVFKKNKNIPLSFFKEATMLVKMFEQHNEVDREHNVWDLKMCFEERKIKFYLNHRMKKNIPDHLFCKWVLNIKPEYNNNKIYERNHETIKLMYKNLPHDEVSTIYHMLQGQKDLIKIRKVLQKLGLDVEEVEDQYLPLIPAIFLNEMQSQGKSDEEKKLKQFIEAAVWENCRVEHVDEKDKRVFSVGYDSREQNRFSMDSDRLMKRIDRLVERYNNIDLNFQNNTYPYDFVWKYIIWKVFAKCGVSFKCNKENKDIQREQQKKYERLRDAVKTLYLEEAEELLDIYTIASCYMSVLMDIPKESLEFREGTDEKAKYQGIFNVGLGLLYMWILSDDENSENEMSRMERRDMLVYLYKQKKLDSFFSKKIKDRHIQLLAAQEKKTFDILSFAELLRWLDDYIKRGLDDYIKNKILV